MDILERLYDCAADHLGSQRKDWPAFVRGFRDIFGAHACLYRMAFDADGTTPTEFKIIATSNEKFTTEYVDRQMHLLHPIKEPSMTPMVSVQRTDTISDEEFLAMGELAQFLVRHGAFYMMMIPVGLPDGSTLGLYTWRNQKQGDFNKAERQRLTLLMRHLHILVDLLALTPIKAAGPDKLTRNMVSFGKRYGLTETEIRIFSALLAGHSPRSIAKQTGRSYGTIRWHVQNILQKCEVSSQKHLIRAFFQPDDAPLVSENAPAR